MLNEKGQEVPDPTPVEVPLKFRGQAESLHEKILRYIRSEEFRQKAEAQGFETEEEANDFDIDFDEGAELPISQAEAAMMIAEELQVRKQDLVDLEGKVEDSKNRKEVGDVERSKVSDQGKSVVSQDREVPIAERRAGDGNERQGSFGTKGFEVLRGSGDSGR